jgi:hypothetical protein
MPDSRMRVGIGAGYSVGGTANVCSLTRTIFETDRKLEQARCIARPAVRTARARASAAGRVFKAEGGRFRVLSWWRMRDWARRFDTDTAREARGCFSEERSQYRMHPAESLRIPYVILLGALQWVLAGPDTGIEAACF